MNALINTIGNPGEFDALASLREGEPYFVLVGRDRFAPDLVSEWANLNRRRAIRERETMDPADYRREIEKSTQAEEIAWAMQAYKAGHKEAAESSSSGKPSYTGHVPSEDQRRRDALQKARVDSASAVSNAVGEMTDLLALLEDGHEARCIRETIKAMTACREMFRLKRPGIDRPEPAAFGPGREA